MALTGVHLLETGQVEAHLPTLNERFRLPFIPELIARKAAAEAAPLGGTDAAFHQRQLDTWEERLGEAHAASALPEHAPAGELHDFLVDLRLGTP